MMPTRKEWLVLALRSAGSEGLSPVQVQKTMFLFRKALEDRLDVDEFYNFAPYNFGPFDATIYSDLERLSMVGLVSVVKTYDENKRLYQLTDSGRHTADELLSGNSKIGDYLNDLTAWVKRKSFEQIVKYVYRKWPEYRKNSIFEDRL